jgi:hypothetical protein
VESAAYRPCHRWGGSSVESGGEWVILKAVAHPKSMSEAEFVVAQKVRATRPTKDGGTRRYLLAGAFGVSAVWAADGFALGARAGRVPLSSRLLERPRSVIGAAEERIRA